MLDALHASRRYPYSQPLADGINYMRNSVKLVIDAYDGTVTAYLADAGRPDHPHLAEVFRRDLPAARQHAGGPARAHALSRRPLPAADGAATPPTTWGAGRVLPPRGPVADPGGDERTRRVPVHAPHHHAPARRDRRRSSSTWCRSRPRGKDNLAAWMVARNDGDDYGKLASTGFRGRAWSSVRSRSRTASTRTPRSPGRSRSGTSAARR